MTTSTATKAGVYPVSRQTAVSIGSHRGAGIGIVAGCSTVEPGFEIAQRMRQAPFVEHRSCHRRYSACGMLALAFLSVGEEPPLEHLRGRIIFDNAFKDLPFER